LTKTKETVETPLMKQYNAIKAKYPGALILFRVGDFYETFGDDAIKASKILGITLTKRGSGSASETELAGFPYHSLDVYLPKLVRAGERVAICDQLEDPKMVKGIVKRGVTELVTPGVALNDNVLDTKRNNYLASVHFGKGNCGISFLDISTGEFFTAQGNLNYIDKLIQSLQPSEILFCKNKKTDFFEYFGDKHCHFMLEDWVYTNEYAYETLTKQFKTQTLKGFGIEEMEDAIVSAGAILNYLSFTEHKEIAHISSIARMDEEKYVWLDKFTIRNLELINTQIPGGVPLIEVIDQTITPMGARLLRNWLLLPLKELKPIEERQEITAYFLKNDNLSNGIVSQLKVIGDLERIISKVAARRINPKELSQLKRALQATEPIKFLLQNENSLLLKKIAEKINLCEFLKTKIENELKDDVPLVTNQGGLIKEGINAELDELRKIAYSGKDYLVQITQREIERTGISSLKIAYNKVFGYYLEVTNVHKNKVPAEWIRKQTTTNAERYITEELKVYEDKILNAEEQIFRIEQRIYEELVLCASEFVNEIQQNAKVLSFIDCLLSFANGCQTV
jgi:DNA mismatch repair protein MutS